MSMDATVAAVSSELDGVFTLKEEKKNNNSKPKLSSVIKMFLLHFRPAMARI